MNKGAKHGAGNPSQATDQATVYPVELLLEGRPVAAIAWARDADWAERIASALDAADAEASRRNREQLRALIPDPTEESEATLPFRPYVVSEFPEGSTARE